MEHLHTFDGKPLKLAEKADLNLSAKKEGALSEDAAKDLAKWLKETLGDKVGEVRASQRLVESPAVVVDADKFMTASMRRMMKAMKQDGPELPAAKHDFEINPAHPIMARLDAMRQKDAALAGSVAEQILDNSRVAAGVLEDPRAMLTRLNSIAGKSAGQKLRRNQHNNESAWLLTATPIDFTRMFKFAMRWRQTRPTTPFRPPA